MSVDLSIVVVHWNVPELLAACLRSLAVETGRSRLRVETLVVDCASPDDRWQRALTDFPVARPIALTENRGYAAGANAGIACAGGEAILLLNPDVEVLPGALDVLWQTLHVTPHIGMVAPLLLNPDGSLQSQGYRFPGVINTLLDLVPAPARLMESPLNGRLPLGDGVSPLAIDYPLGAAMLVRLAAIEQVGGLDEGYGMYSEEIDWARRFRAAGWSILLAPRAHVTHHGGQSTAQRPAAMHEALWLSRARYSERWSTRRQRRALGPLVRAGLTLADWRDPSLREANARIRARFARLTDERA